MEFKKERVYSAVNADELRAGDKVIVADDLDTLKRCVKDNSPIDTLRMVGNEDYLFRFGVKDNCVSFALAYLVERNENCTNCGNRGNSYCSCFIRGKSDDELSRTFCGNYIRLGEQKAEKAPAWFVKGLMDGSIERTSDEAETPELISLGNGQYVERKHYRPFRDTDELIKVWNKKLGYTDPTGSKLTEPYIWVQDKDNDVGKAQHLITDFNVTSLNEDNDEYDVGITVNCADMTLEDLFEHFEFLDGSPCGVEE